MEGSRTLESLVRFRSVQVRVGSFPAAGTTLAKARKQENQVA